MISGFRVSVFLALLVLAVVPAAVGQAGERQEAVFVSQPEIVVPVPSEVYLESLGPSEPDAPVEYRDILVNGAMTSVQTRRVDNTSKRFVIQAAPIAEALEGEFEAIEETIVYKSGDGRVLRSLNATTGTLRSDGIVIGELRVDNGADKASLWLTVEEIAALTDTRLADFPDGSFEFVQNDTPQRTYNLDLSVNGRIVNDYGAEPRMVAGVLLIPLRQVVAELGHDLRVEPGAVEVVRVQDSKIVRLDLASGLMSVNGTPAGVTPDMVFADLDELLLPHTAIEALTGAHVSTEPGSNRVRVDLDDRLDTSALPGTKVASGAGRDPFTPEALSYQLSDRGPLRAEFSSRIDRYNSRLTYESAGGFGRSEELQPAWASVDLQTLDGWAGSAGDYTTGRFRELSGVDVARIRGASYRQTTESGDLLAVAAGATLTDTEAITDTANKPEFGGFAGGLRLLSEDGTREIGASAKTADEGDTSAFVVSGQKVFDQSERPGPLKTFHVSADAGYFDTISGEALDVRAGATARYQLTKQINAAISAYHDGEKFAETANPSKFEGIFDNRVGARTGGSVSADWRSAESVGPLQFVSVGGRASVNRIGGAEEVAWTRLQAMVATRVGANGPDVAVDIDHTDAEFSSQSEVSDRVQVRVAQGFDWGAVQARYVAEDTDVEDREFAVVSVQGNPLKQSFGDGAFTSIAPTLNVGWIDDESSMRAGASAAFSTGRKLGDRLALDGQVSALSSVDPEDFGTRYFADLQARFRVDARTELVARYVDDLDGRKDLSFALRGTLVFNPPRKLDLPVQDRGTIGGAIFVDLNNDGARQVDEPALSGAEVEIRDASMSLTAGDDGRFSGRNLREGIAGMSVVPASLPLGYLPAANSPQQTEISASRPAKVDMPVERAIELRGAVFIDFNKDGVVGPGDQRLEGQLVQIINESTGRIDQVASAAFGQYCFQNMSPGTYRLRVMVGWQEYAVDVEIGEDEIVETAAIAIPPEVLGLSVQYQADGGTGHEQAA